MAEEGGIKRLYPIIIGVALVGALLFLWKGRDTPIKNMPTETDAGNPYLCTACGHTEELSPHARAEWIKEKSQKVERGGVQGGPRTSMRKSSLACRECGAMELQLASKCLKCSTIYRAGACPVCIPEVPDEPKEKGEKKPRPPRKR